MDTAKDIDLYRTAKRWADAHYMVPSAYKSMAIQKKYIELYEYKHGDKNAYYGKSEGKLGKWRKEKWVDVESYLNGMVKPCGSVPYSDASYVACRPLAKLKKMPREAIEAGLKAKKEFKHNSVDWNNFIGIYK